MTGPACISRRRFVLGCSSLAGGFLLGGPRRTQAGEPRLLHGLSAFGELKYAPDFTHFDYANPAAPKGGTFSFSPPNWAYNQNVQTFNTLNSFVTTGDAPPRMELCFDSLMARALDEPDAIYGLLAESVEVSDDENSFTFRLREGAAWHDGTPLTAEDVAFTYETFRENGHPLLSLPLRELSQALAIDARTFRLVFTGRQAPRAILTVAQFPIISRAYFTEHPFDSSELHPPLGSGPYRVGRFTPGLSIEYERVEDYWGRNLPVNRGLGHFGRIRIDFFRDRQAAFEAFKKGDVTWRQEFTSRVWATEYDFPALIEGKVVKRGFPSEKNPSMQAWALNQRRTRFQDRRVREAIGLCFDFEWSNRNLFFGLYERSQSCFERSEFKATGLPSPEELVILERFRGQIPDAAFGEAIMQPVSDGSGRDRRLLSAAARLLAEAGWQRRDGMLRNDRGESLRVEILIRDEVFLRVDQPFAKNMQAIGIDASVRLVDAAQFQARQASFDFDMIGMALTLPATPSEASLENLFHSRAARVSGSRNLPGTSDPAVDALVDLAGRARSRAQLVTAMRALDRVLRARHDWIPNWYAPNHNVAYWDMFGFREPKPDYGFPVESLWWYEEERARAIGKA